MAINLFDLVIRVPFKVEPILEELSKIPQSSWSDHQWHDSVNDKFHTQYGPKSKVFTPPMGDELDKLTYLAIDSCFQAYAQSLPPEYNIGLSSSSRARFNSYGEGQGMAVHVDAIRTLFSGPQRGVPVLSIVGLVQDAEEGGEFYLSHERMELEPGQAIVFPSALPYPHEVKPVIKGERISFVSWIW